MSHANFPDLFSLSDCKDLNFDMNQAPVTIELSLGQLDQVQGGAVCSQSNSAQLKLLAWLKATQPSTFCGWKVPAGFKW
jgi:hypothetical protein